MRTYRGLSRRPRTRRRNKQLQSELTFCFHIFSTPSPTSPTIPASRCPVRSLSLSLSLYGIVLHEMDESASYHPSAAAASPRTWPLVRRKLGKAVPLKGRMKAKRPPPPSGDEQTGSYRAADLALDGGALREAPSDPHADTLSQLPGGPADTAALDQVDAAIEMELQALEELKARREAARRRLLRQQQQGTEFTGHLTLT